MESLFENPTPARQYALEFLAHATAGTRGVRRGDAPYERVTEGRHTGPGYSGCGDLGNALLYALGIRERDFVNRVENNSYRIGFNVATLDTLAGTLRKYKHQPITADDVTRLEPGDITIVWNRPDTTDAHVAVVRRYEQGKLYTSDYGQGAPLDGKECTRVVNGTLLGARKLQRIIKLDEALERFMEAEPIPLEVYFPPATERARRTLRKGDKGEDVVHLQTRLSAMRPPLKLLLDGDFGPKTDAAVRSFQSAYSLTVDGIVGPKTWAALEN